MWEYQIVVTEYCNKKDLKKVLNKLGESGWDVFTVVGCQKSDVRGKGDWKTEYTLYMKKPILSSFNKTAEEFYADNYDKITIGGRISGDGVVWMMEQFAIEYHADQLNKPCAKDEAEALMFAQKASCSGFQISDPK